MATRPVDEKIVAMKMDNSDFVKKASETTTLMGKFTNALNKIPGINIGKTTSELQNVQKSINGMDTSRLSSSIDAITSRFSTMGIIGTTALVNIANRAVDTGLAMMRNLTIAPVMDGFREYETKIGSIQTILANTSKYGTSIDDVTKSLGELNTYADKTIYNFGDMTKNIGLFTNAGLKLEESTSMIKGFANAAAASGAKAEQMAAAAYQMSQGLSSGYLMQMDWMSLTNAGMGNDNMKRDLIALGQAMGTLGDSTEATMKDWKNSLSDKKWLTKEVFSTYLQAMAGDLDEAKLKTIGLTKAQAELLLQNAKNGEDAATKVRTFTQMIGTVIESIGSGWAQSWEIMFGGFNDATKLWSGFTELISEPFNKLTTSRNKFLQTLKDAGVFKELLTSLGTVIYVVGKAIGAVTDGFDAAFSSGKTNIVTSLVQGFKNLVSALTPSEASLAKISTIFQAVGSTVQVFMKIVTSLGSLLFKLIPDNLGPNLLSILATIAKMVISFNETILKGNLFKNTFKNIGDVFTWLGSRIGDVVKMFSNFTTVMSNVWSVLNTGEQTANSSFSKDSAIVVWLAAIGAATKSVTEKLDNMNLSLAPIKESFNSFFKALVTGFNWFKDRMVGLGRIIQDNMPSGTTLMAGGFVAALVAISGIVLKRVNDISKIFGGWGKTVQAFAETLDSVGGALDSFALNLKANALLTASIAVGALAVSILLLSRLDGGEIGNSLLAIVGSLTAVIGAMAIMNKYDITGGLKVTTSIIAMAIGLSVMSIALKQFGSMNPQELTKGLIAIVTLMGALSGAFALMGKFNTNDIAVSAAQIVAMSISILIISKAVKDMAAMKPEQLAKGIAGLAGILLSISGAFALMGKFGAKGSSASAVQFIAIAGSVMMLVAAIKMISAINTADLLVGLGTITAILGVIAGFSKLTSNTGLLSSAAGILAISIAMNALIIPIFAIGNFPLDKLVIGLLGMAGALLAIAAASKLMGGSLAGSASILAMAVALNLLIIPIAAFAAMGWGPMLTGIAGLALSLAALGGVSLLLSEATPFLLAFAAGIGVMGLAMLAAGAGMTLFSTGLLALAGMASAAVATIVTTLGALIAGLTSLVPAAVKFVINIVQKILEAIRDNAPKLIATVVQIMIKIMDTMATYIPQFATSAVKMITSFIDAIATERPKLINSVVNLIITTVQSMADTINKEGPRFINAFLDLYKAILTIIVKAGTAAITAMFGWIPGVKDAMQKVSETASKTIAESFEAAKVAENKGQEFANGLESSQSVVRLAAQNLSVSADEGLKATDATKTGSSFATNFANGMLNRKADVKNASFLLANAANDGVREKLEIHSPSKKGEENGEHFGDGHVIGIENSTDKVKKAASNMANGALDGTKGVYSKVKDMLFLKDGDVKENSKKVATVSDSYAGVAEKAEKSSKSRAKSADTAAKAEKSAFDKSKEWIDDRKYYQELSLEQELAAWQRMQKQYKVGTDERKQADKEVFRLKQEIVKQTEQAEKDAFDKSKGWISDRKYYNEMSLKEELATWEKLQKRYKEGTDQRKEADKEVYRLKNELMKEELNNSKDYISEKKAYDEMSLADELAAWERVQSRYKEGTDQRKEADKEVYRLKNEINQKLIDVNKEYTDKVLAANQKLIDSEKQLNDEYQRAVDDRTKALTGFAGLFDQVTSSTEVTGQQLIDNLTSQVSTMAVWMTNIQTLAAKGLDPALMTELMDMGPKASGEIAALTTLTDEQLSQYSALWKTKNNLARTEAVAELQGLNTDTQTKIQELRDQTATDLDGFKAEWLAKIQEIKTGTTGQFLSLNADMKTVGVNAIKGLQTGMANMAPALMVQAKGIADAIAATIKTALDIHSPSRVMMGLGEFAGEGLAVGLENSSKSIVERSKDLALNAVDSINNFISTFQQPVLDNEIHLKAVLDDSDVTGKLKNLNNTSLLSLGTTNSLVSSTMAASRQNGNTMPSGTTGTPSEVSKSTVINQNLTFTSRQLTPSEVARKSLQASRQLAMQWGV